MKNRIVEQSNSWLVENNHIFYNWYLKKKLLLSPVFWSFNVIRITVIQMKLFEWQFARHSTTALDACLILSVSSGLYPYTCVGDTCPPPPTTEAPVPITVVDPNAYCREVQGDDSYMITVRFWCWFGCLLLITWKGTYFGVAMLSCQVMLACDVVMWCWHVMLACDVVIWCCHLMLSWDIFIWFCLPYDVACHMLFYHVSFCCHVMLPYAVTKGFCHVMMSWLSCDVVKWCYYVMFS